MQTDIYASSWNRTHDIPVFQEAKIIYALDRTATNIIRKHFFVQRGRIIVTVQLGLA
jgi:hypothetical protein